MIYDPHYDPEEQGGACEQVERLRKKSLLKSINKGIRTKRENSANPAEAKLERFNRVVRQGAVMEIRSAVLEAKRELDQHRKMGRFTKTSFETAEDFARLADELLRRKIVLDKLEERIKQSRAKLRRQPTTDLELHLTRTVENAEKIANDARVITDRLIVLYERVERQIRRDRSLEQELRKNLDRCLDKLSKQERGRLLATLREKYSRLPIDRRIALYSQLIQKFAQKIPEIREEEIARCFEFAQTQVSRKQYKKALGALDKVFMFDRRHLASHRLRADIFREIGNKPAFLCELRMIVKIDSAEACDFCFLAEMLSENGHLEEAYEYYEQAASKDPSLFYLERFGDVCVDLRRWRRAEQIYRRILQQSPDLSRVLHKYGRALLENGREDEALEILNKAIQIKDDNSHSHVCIGRIDRRQSSFTRAGYSFQRAVELDDANVEAYYWWSVSLLSQEKAEDALPKIQKAVELEPKRARNRICIARCLDALQKSGEALEHLKPFLSAATPSVDVLLTYSKICRNAKQEECAADALKRFLNRYPRQPQIRREYGALLSQTGRVKEAEEYLAPRRLPMAS